MWRKKKNNNNNKIYYQQTFKFSNNCVLTTLPYSKIDRQWQFKDLLSLESLEIFLKALARRQGRPYISMPLLWNNSIGKPFSYRESEYTALQKFRNNSLGTLLSCVFMYWIDYVSEQGNYFSVCTFLKHLAYSGK